MNSAGSRGEYGTGSHCRPKEGLVPNPKAPLLQQIHEVMRFFHYSRRTEQTYWQWIHLRQGFGGASGYPDRSGFAGTPGCGDDPDLHPCYATARTRRSEPARLLKTDRKRG